MPDTVADTEKCFLFGGTFDMSRRRFTPPIGSGELFLFISSPSGSGAEAQPQTIFGNFIRIFMDLMHVLVYFGS